MLSNYRHKDWIKKYKFQLILSLCLTIAPITTYLHLIFDRNQRTLELFGYNIETAGITFSVLTWILLSDIASIIILTVVFFSTSDKWKYTLTLPIVFYLDNFLLYFNEINDFSNAYSYFKYLNIAVFVIIIILIDRKLFARHRQRVINIKISSLISESTTNNLREIRKMNNRPINALDKKNNSKLLKALYNSKLHFDELILIDVKSANISELIGSSYIKNIISTLLVLLSLSLWFLHYYIPKGVSAYNIGFLTITPHGYNDVQIFIWAISRKIMVIVPMIIWFITFPSWWRYAVLTPLIIYLFQFWEALQDGYCDVDAYGNYKVFPFVLLSVILLLVLSRIIRSYSHSLDTYEQITQDIDHLINKIGAERSKVEDYRSRFEQIRNKLLKDSSTDSDLKELARLQKELQNKVLG